MIKRLSDYQVGLPNGEMVNATQEGFVCLSDKITLKHVLYVPQLSCNLILVSRTNDDLQCTVQFNSYMCAMQDQLRELIGTSVKTGWTLLLRQNEVSAIPPYQR